MRHACKLQVTFGLIGSAYVQCASGRVLVDIRDVGRTVVAACIVLVEVVVFLLVKSINT